MGEEQGVWNKRRMNLEQLCTKVCHMGGRERGKEGERKATSAVQLWQRRCGMCLWQGTFCGRL